MALKLHQPPRRAEESQGARCVAPAKHGPKAPAALAQHYLHLPAAQTVACYQNYWYSPKHRRSSADQVSDFHGLELGLQAQKILTGAL